MKKQIKLDREEQQILQEFESGELESSPDLKKEKKELEITAHQTLLKDKRINIRISSRERQRIQKRTPNRE